MKLKRRFYDSSINLKSISTGRLVLGVIIGLAFAFAIYGFFYALRESFRLMNYGFANFPYILSESDRTSYNLFFAGLSVVFANSIMFNFLFSKLDSGLSRRNPKRRRILNDQVFLSFNFSYWFTKMGLVFFAFSMCCMDFDFSLYVGLVSTLLLVVLYLESWKTLSLVFRKNRLKIQIIHFITLLVLVFGLSRINVINYKALDEIAIKASPKYDLPHSDFYSDINNRYPRAVKIKIETSSDSLRIRMFDKWFTIDDIPAMISAERASIREELIPFLMFRITANRDIDLKYIKMIEAKLISVNHRNIIYDIYNDDLLVSRFENKGIYKRIVFPVYHFEVDRNYPIPPMIPLNLKEGFFKDTLHVSINQKIEVNGLFISKDSLKHEFKKYVKSKTLFIYHFNSKTKYQDYITVLSSHFSAVHELREKIQTVFKENRYDDNQKYRNEQNQLKEKYPIMIMDKLN